MPLFVWLKAAGCVCLLAGAAGAGHSLAVQYLRRLRELSELRRLMLFLKGQIVYAGVPLAEALLETGGRLDGAVGRMFRKAGQRLSDAPGEPFARIWEEAAKELGEDCALTGEDRQSLLRLPECLGYLDRETQERSLLLYLEELDAVIGELGAQRKERCRLYTGLGILGGLFLAILLC